MSNNKYLFYLTKVCTVILVISFILSVFNIGPTMNPIYMYINNIDIVRCIVFISFTLIFLLTTVIIFLFLSKKINSIYNIAPICLLASVCLDIVLGGNIFFFVSSIVSMIVFSINLLQNKRSKLI